MKVKLHQNGDYKYVVKMAKSGAATPGDADGSNDLR